MTPTHGHTSEFSRGTSLIVFRNIYFSFTKTPQNAKCFFSSNPINKLSFHSVVFLGSKVKKTEKIETIYFSKDTFSQMSISCSGILRSKNVYYIPFLDSTKHNCLSTFPHKHRGLVLLHGLAGLSEMYGVIHNHYVNKCKIIPHFLILEREKSKIFASTCSGF